MSTGRTKTRVWAPMLLSLILVLAAACSAPDDEPDPGPTRTRALNTIEASDIGDRLTLTAVVVGVYTTSAFVVDDADLPDQGQLVLGAGPAVIRQDALVTLTATVDLFLYERFRDRFGLTRAPELRRFEGRKVLIADTVRSWADPRAADRPRSPDTED